MASYGERRRHHRVGKKAAEHANHDACCITKCGKRKYIAIAIVAGIVLFVKGIVIGMLISKE